MIYHVNISREEYISMISLSCIAADLVCTLLALLPVIGTYWTLHQIVIWGRLGTYGNEPLSPSLDAQIRSALKEVALDASTATSIKELSASIASIMLTQGKPATFTDTAILVNEEFFRELQPEEIRAISITIGLYLKHQWLNRCKALCIGFIVLAVSIMFFRLGKLYVEHYGDLLGVSNTRGHLHLTLAISLSIFVLSWLTIHYYRGYQLKSIMFESMKKFETAPALKRYYQRVYEISKQPEIADRLALVESYTTNNNKK